MRAFGMLMLMAVSMPYALAECRITNSELEQMNVRQARFRGPDERRVDLQVHVADSGRERAAGFQHVCPETAESTSILFLFANPHVPSFHMRNVYMPLDIAFIDDSGVIRDIQTMQPYIIGTREMTLWSPPVPIVAALEVRGGLFEELGITANEWSISLQR